MLNDILQKSTPLVEFESQYFGRFPDIEKELRDKELPIIVWVNIAEKYDTVWHGLVVTGFNDEIHSVLFNDPDNGKGTPMEVGEFINRAARARAK